MVRRKKPYRDSFMPFHSMKRAMLRWASTVPLRGCLRRARGFSAHLAPARAEPPGVAAGAAPTEAATAKVEPRGWRPSVDDICRTLAQAAADNALPEELFTRPDLAGEPLRRGRRSAGLARRASRSSCRRLPAMRGLTNAFEPLQALRESASYLRELRTTFRGNLGLAAAAYNAGPGAVEAWLAKRSVFPAELKIYVMIVTGYAAEAWASKSPPQVEASAAPPSTPEMGVRCAEIAKSMIERTRSVPISPPTRPGGRGVSSSPATGPKPVCWPPTSGCAASTSPSWETACRWS